jgi:hypothetical protein
LSQAYPFVFQGDGWSNNEQGMRSLWWEL